MLTYKRMGNVIGLWPDFVRKKFITHIILLSLSVHSPHLFILFAYVAFLQSSK